jgi:hypothetical protein
VGSLLFLIDQGVDARRPIKAKPCNILPECYRVDAINMLELPVGLGRQHTIAVIDQFSSGLYPRLLKLPDLPEDIRRLCKAESEKPVGESVFTLLRNLGRSKQDSDEYKTRQKLVRSLIDQPDEKDIS